MLFLLISLLFPIYLIKIYLQYKYERVRSRFQIIQHNSKIVAFFHPLCNVGGGGERVLWSAIKSLHQQYPEHCYIIYSDNYNIEPSQIVNKARDTFQLDLNIRVHFIKLHLCPLLSPKYYSISTLLAQNIASFIVGLEALLKCPPDIYIDTMGASFTYPIFRFLGFSKVCSYTHYPIISVEMLNVVANNQSTFNNREFIAKCPVLTKLKLIYYRILSYLYLLVGRCANVVMVNSTWTKNHIEQLWKRKVSIVYPPCNVDNLIKLNLTQKNPNVIISIGQFRPEKNHQLQLELIAELVEILKENGSKQRPLLIIVGSCRNQKDEERVQKLKQQCIKLKIQDYVQFKVNIGYKEMVELIEKSSIAIHTMKNEHFGISVVEFLAAGLLTLVHNSGGPKLDIIIENETGFLAEDCNQFAHKLFKLFSLTENEAHTIRLKARESVQKFSQETFERSFCEQISAFFM